MTTRRNFLRLAGTMAAGGVITQYSTDIASALEQATEGSAEVVWLQGQSCSGDSVSLLQGDYPSLSEVISDFRLEVTFHPTLMAESGEAAMDAMSTDPDVLVVEGSIPTDIPSAATLGYDENGEKKPLADWVQELAPKSDYVVATGNCSAFGGLPAAENKKRLYDLGPNVTGARGLQFDGREEGGVLGADFTSAAGLPVVNLAGCPTHPDYILLTLATVLNGHAPELDQYNRPLAFFEDNIHDTCALRGYFDRGEFAEKPGEDGCLYEVGCAGPYVHCDESERLWNDGTSVCRNVGAPCIGCMEPAFWDRFSPYYEPIEQQNAFGVDAETAGKVAIGGAAVGIGAHAARKAVGYGDTEDETPEPKED
ncbi:Ni,Fe-hydrogenase I small subunit [Halanaeroarchaeum sp. HSR-CO]|uniref:hydrogenase small subunit n=1 Tax=Halanaeroarchaeum sp. HSR-CO TaxID=2866382 RepID=UPI00217F1173|nr:twin-arginine translocation signal domain-containing protein [Halanaeroarchaeum sp. HSR-CO]UWG47176.1 Ni,Fe-hydrogenase I small subunit [Halanaeroarchaeum sp. HSR-CO]